MLNRFSIVGYGSASGRARCGKCGHVIDKGEPYVVLSDDYFNSSSRYHTACILSEVNRAVDEAGKAKLAAILAPKTDITISATRGAGPLS